MKNSIGDERLRSFRLVLKQELDKKGDSFAVLRQKERLSKKMSFSDVSQDLTDKAFDDFITLNTRLGQVEVNLDPYIHSNAQLFIERALMNSNARRTGAIQCTLDYSELLNDWRFGPGASNGMSGSHFADKVTQPFSSDGKCLDLGRLLRRMNPYMSAFDCDREESLCVVPGSLLSTVPKNEDTMRTIAIEPLVNMTFQLSLGLQIERALDYIGIHISGEPGLNQASRNKLLARSGSITGKLATIDLKSASDMFQPKLVRMLFPDDMFNFMMKIRSEYTEIRGELHKLNMISTMGNGFTFPMMTMTFVALYYGFLCKKGAQKSFHLDYQSFGVFGDDIILPVEHFQEFCDVLTEAGLVINKDKSFVEGPFRESCGGDYWNGVDVTPFYPKSLADDAEIYVVINQLLEWCAKTHKSLDNTLKFLIGCLYDPTKPLLVPEWYPDYSGIRTTLVPKRFTALAIYPQYRTIPESPLLYVGCLHGSVSQSADGSFKILPRETRKRYKVERCRLPSGWVTGRDPCKRENEVSRYIDFAILYRDLE